MRRERKEKRKRWAQLAFPLPELAPVSRDTTQPAPELQIAKQAGKTLAWLDRIAGIARGNAWPHGGRPDRARLAAIAGAVRTIGLLTYQCIGCVPEAPRKSKDSPPLPNWELIEQTAKERGKVVEIEQIGLIKKLLMDAGEAVSHRAKFEGLLSWWTKYRETQERRDQQAIEYHAETERQIEEALAKSPTLSAERKRLDFAAAIRKEVLGSQSTFDLETAWRTIHREVTEESERESLVALWSKRAESLGISEGTLRDLGEKGVGPYAGQQPKKRRRTRKQSEVAA